MTASIKASADGAQAIIQVGGVDRLAIDSTTQFGNRNKIINGNFGINQRGVSGTVTLGAGVYGHDRWKAGASGCTYTFATANNVTTITITAGSLMQVIEGLNLFSGTHILSWSGTAQGRVDSGSYGGSGVLGTAVGGTNQTIEFGTGTVSKVQYEQGNVATPFEHRPYGTELALCQRYYEVLNYGTSTYAALSSMLTSTANSRFQWLFKVTKRAAPTSGVQTGSWVVITPNAHASISQIEFEATNYFYATGTAGQPGPFASAEL